MEYSTDLNHFTTIVQLHNYIINPLSFRRVLEKKSESWTTDQRGNLLQSKGPAVVLWSFTILPPQTTLRNRVSCYKMDLYSHLRGAEEIVHRHTHYIAVECWATRAVRKFLCHKSGSLTRACCCLLMRGMVQQHLSEEPKKTIFSRIWLMLRAPELCTGTDLQSAKKTELSMMSLTLLCIFFVKGNIMLQIKKVKESLWLY